MKNYYYIDTANQTQGPHTIEELNQLACAGVIKADTMIAAHGDPDWQPFRTHGQGKPPRPIAEILKKAANAFQRFGTDPVGGMPNACKALDNSSAIGVGLTFCVFFVGCSYVFAQGILSAESFKQVPKLNMLLAAAAPFVCLTAASFLTRSAFRGAGNLGTDCFIAGAALLPSAFLLALIGLLGVGNIEVIAISIAFAACLTVLMLYTGCHRISGLSQRTATFAVPVMLISSVWLGKIVYMACTQPNGPGLSAAHRPVGKNGPTGVFGSPSILGSPYSVEYKVVSLNEFHAGVEATVRGPAAKLAVILADPKGESAVQVIAKEDMISNSRSLQLPMQDPQAGTYVLTVKTIDPETIVWQKEITFSLRQLMVADVKFHFEPNHYFMGGLTGSFALGGLEIALRKDGNLPVSFTDVSVAVGDANRGFCSIVGDHTMIGQQQTVGVSMSLFSTEKMKEEERRRGWGGLPSNYALFWPGDRYLVKGKLLYGKDRKSLDFEKEFVAPGNGTRGTGTQNTRERIPGLRHGRNYNSTR